MGVQLVLDGLEWFFTSFGKAAAILVILLLTWIAAAFVRRVMEKPFKDKTIGIDRTQHVFLRHLVSFVIYILGIGFAVYLIPSLRSLSVSIFAGAGVLAVVIGFAAQQALSNVIAGVFIAIFKPFRLDDRVMLVGKNVGGVVEDITLRHTVIRTFENKRVIVPNSVMSSEVIENANLGDDKICKFIELGISYDSDVDKAMAIMREEAERHPLFIDNRVEEDKKEGKPAVPVRLVGFGDSSVNLRAWVWCSNPGDAFVLGCDLNKSIKERFGREGIEIPFPHRTIVYKEGIPKKRK